MKKNFLGIKNVKMSEAKFVIIPIPFEFSTSFIKGTVFAPESIISVSEQLEFFDEKYQIEPYKCGIRTLSPLQINIEKPSSMIKIIEREAKKIIGKGKFLISIGGEHTITYGLVKAFRHFHKNFNILILDAHSDLRDSYQGSKFSHACVSRRIVEDGFKVFITGVRSTSKEEFVFAESNNYVEIFYAYRMKKMDWKNKIAKNLPSGKYYLSFDADFFDPSVLPEVGTPEPGGFLWDETVEFLENFILRNDIEVIGFDFVELSPRVLNSPSSFISSKLIYKTISYLCLNENKTNK